MLLLQRGGGDALVDDDHLGLALALDEAHCHPLLPRLGRLALQPPGVDQLLGRLDALEDAADPHGVAALQAVADAIPKLDILINNAGASLPDGKDEYDPDVFEKAVTINLTSNYRLADALKETLAASEAPTSASIDCHSSRSGVSRLCSRAMSSRLATSP